jgi:hypothetical protein
VLLDDREHVREQLALEGGQVGRDVRRQTMRLLRSIDGAVAGDRDGRLVQRAARDRRVGTRLILLRRGQAACRRVVSLVRYRSPSSSL